MHSFEYLRSIGIGYYYPGSSPLHGRDARVKILFFLLLIIASTFTTSLYGLLLGLVIGFLGFWIAKVSVLPSLRTVVGILPFIFLLFIIQVLIFRPDASSLLLWEWNFVHVYWDGIISAVMILLRFLTLLFILGLMTAVISTLEMNHGLELLLRPMQRIGIRTESFVMIIQIMLRFLPLLAIRMEQIAKSQAARGAAWDKGKGGLITRVRLVFPLLIPLFLSTLQQAERTADAMLCRGYGVFPTRTHSYQYRLQIGDLVFLFAGVSISVLIFFFPVPLQM